MNIHLRRHSSPEMPANSSKLATLVFAALLLGLAAIPGGPVSAQGQVQQTAVERCFEHHKFGAQPVDVAKTADGHTVLAQTSWGYHDSIGCYLSLDDGALATLRDAPPPQSLPDAGTAASLRCFEHHKFGAQPVDAAKTADGHTVLARLSWGYHDTIGCYLVLDDTALAALRAAHTGRDSDTGATDAGTTDTDPAEASPQITPIAAGYTHTCAIKTDRAIACWGSNSHGQLDAPAGQYTAIAAGHSYSCAIKTDSAIACWGWNDHGEADAPAGQYTAVVSEYGHSCAIRTDRAIACWGVNWNGQVDAPTGQYAALAAGSSFSCAIRTDSAIVCWGLSRHGEADAPAGEYTTVASGGDHSCAIRTDRAIVCWGANSHGQADAPTGAYTAVAAGNAHSCATRTDHTIVCWGANQHGQASVPARLRKSEGDILDVRTALESDPVDSADQSFEVVVEFTHPVSGFSASDITVVNGDVTSLTGSGSEYRATIQATSAGTVVLWVGRNTVEDQRGEGNEPSQPLVASVRQRSSIFFDTWDREAVLAGFTAEFDRHEPDPGWTGDLARCIAGTTSQEYRDSIFQRMNWYRQIAGVPPMVEDPELSKSAQAKALILAAEGRLSHRPRPDWACYTSIPRQGDSESIANISGIASINAYMQDSGSNNKAVGHRRMITDASLGPFGTGDIPGRANTLHAQYSSSQGEVREQRGFVAWPSPGYTPYPIVWGRWSFTMQTWADFSNASVAVVDDNGPVRTEVIHNRDSALVWAMDGDADSHRHARPWDGDHCYAVTISGVQIDGITQAPYEYATCVTDNPRQ